MSRPLNLLMQHQQLVLTKYFTSRVFDNKAKQKRQTAFIEALETPNDVQLFYGKYYHVERRCTYCGRVITVPNEKMTDVNIATELIADAFQDRFDVALLVSGDSELVGPVSMVKRTLPGKRVLVAFPPRRFCNELANLTSQLVIGRGVIAHSQLPEEVRKADGFILKRPLEWT